MAGSHIVDQALALFGRPKSVTAFFRSLRGGNSKNEDSYTIILRYDTPLLVQLSTNPFSIMPRFLTQFVRGSKGSFIHFGRDPQLHQLSLGLNPDSPGFGSTDLPEDWGTLSTTQNAVAGQVLSNDIWTGRFPPVPGSYRNFYVDLVKAIRGEIPVAIDPKTARDGIRVLELAWQSSEQGRSIPYSACDPF